MKKICLKKCDKLKADISTLRRSGRGCLGKFLANYKTLSKRERKREIVIMMIVVKKNNNN